MSRKRLPKAITRPAADVPEADARVELSEQRPARARRSPTKSRASDEAPAPSQPFEPVTPQRDEPAAPQPSSQSAKAEPIVEPSSTPLTGEVLAPAPAGTGLHATQRRTVAEKIVERYKLYAALGGLSPVPIVTAAGVTTVILRMVKILSNVYQVPFERERTRSIIAGLMGGAVPTGLGVATASTLALAIPGVGFVGVAVSALTAAAATERIGHAFIERFESDAAAMATTDSSA